MEMASEGIVTLSADNGITFANEKFAQMAGCRAQEMIGRPIGDFLIEAAREVTKSKTPNPGWGSTGQYDAKLSRSDGTHVWVLVSGHPLLDENGEIEGSLRMFTDITERKEAEHALRSSQEFLRNLVDSSLDMIIATDKDRHITEFNKAAEKCFGYRRDEVVGKPIDILYANPKDGSQISQSVIEKNGVVREVVNRRKSGDFFPCLLSAALILDSSGNFTGTMGVSRDISDQRRTEEQLFLLGAAIRDTLDPVLIIDSQLALLDPAIIFTNTAFCKLTGYSELEILGKNTHVLNGPKTEKAFLDGLTLSLREQKSFVGETINYSKDGRELHLEWHVSPVHDDGRRVSYYVAVLRDVEDLRKMEAERLRASRLESIGVLAAGIGHDFNNLLMAIRGNVAVARESQTDTETIHLLDEAEKAIRQATSLARQLLTFSKGGAPVKKIISLAPLLHDAPLFILHGSKVKAEFDIAADLWPVEADEHQLRQCVDNLVINAMQAMPNGGRIWVRAANTFLDDKDASELTLGDYVRFSISDEGCGIPTDLQSKIFDPYFTTKSTGSGLGLATLYSIIRRHGGSVMLDSEEGVGTTFTILLPAKHATPDQPATAPATIVKGTGRVLVMDDDALVLRALRNMLKSLGYTVHEAHNGTEALEAYKQSVLDGDPYRFATLDLTVPGAAGGADVIADFLRADPCAQVIACSGYSNDPILGDAASHGFSGALVKPFDLAELSRVIASLKKP